MSINYPVAYATALFDIAETNKKIDSYFSQVKMLLEVFIEYQDFNSFINNLSIEKEFRKSALKEIFQNELDLEIINWLFVIVDNYKTGILTEIVKSFLKKCDFHFKILFLKVSSAYNLQKDQLDRIKSVFESEYKSRVAIINEVNAKCIGGIKLEFDSKTYDDTISGRLENIKNKNLKNQFQEEK